MISTVLKRAAPFFLLNRPRLPINAVDSRVAIHWENGYCYFRVPKAGNSSVSASLAGVSGNDLDPAAQELKSAKSDPFRQASSLNWSEYRRFEREFFKFTFVRNPLDRLLSAFLDKVDNERSPPHFRRLINTRLGSRDADSSCDFPTFLNYLSIGGLHENAHWAPQVSVICYPIEKLDFVGRLENMEHDLNHVLSVLNLKGSRVTSVRKHHTRSRHLREILDARAKSLIHELYAEDFERFGYARPGG